MKAARSMPTVIVWIIQGFLMLALPVALVLANARILMNEPFLQWEYNRPGFPADPFGFTTEDRLAYAPLAMEYLFSDKGIEFLADQTMSGGSPLYSPRELSHMDDVKNVTTNLTRYGLTLIGVYVVLTALLSVSAQTRPALYRAVLWGSILTTVLIVSGLITLAISFRWLFTEFHRLFFTGDTWLFPTSDTLIRLFPEQFWTDAFIFMFGGALIEAILLGIGMWLLLKRLRPDSPV